MTLLGVESVPVCGTNDEVLRAHGLDPAAIADRVEAAGQRRESAVVPA